MVVAGKTSELVLDVYMPGQDGMALQADLAAQGVDLPIVFCNGHGGIPMTVEVMKNGAAESPRCCMGPTATRQRAMTAKYAEDRGDVVRVGTASVMPADGPIDSETARRIALLGRLTPGCPDRYRTALLGKLGLRFSIS